MFQARKGPTEVIVGVGAAGIRLYVVGSLQLIDMYRWCAPCHVNQPLLDSPCPDFF
jgi:hypothetical protein